MDAMINVSHHRTQLMDVSRAGKQVQQGHGIGTPRNCDEDGPGSQVEAPDIGKEPSEERHAQS
jgi:hypothetical protein